MHIQYYGETSLSALQQALAEFSQKASVNSLFLLACDQNAWSKAALDPVLAEVTLPMVGGIFPQVVDQTQAYETGFVLVGLEDDILPVLIEGLDDNQADFEAQLDQAIEEDVPFSSMVVFVDGLSSRISNFVDSLFALFGSEVSYIGGGAGSLSFESRPCVLTNQGVFANAAVLGLTHNYFPIEVGHGWRAFDSGHVVTEVEKNRVLEIDYKNALSVYQSIIGDQLLEGPHLTPDNFFTQAQSFPLGIKRADGLHVVRDPIAIDEQGALICVGELSKGDHIDILTADPQELIDSAGQIAQTVKTADPTPPSGVMLIDCISRALFLKDAFGQELDAVGQTFGAQVPLFGALVLGEIANSGTGYLEFYNKTSVIARF